MLVHFAKGVTCRARCRVCLLSPLWLESTINVDCRHDTLAWYCFAGPFIATDELAQSAADYESLADTPFTAHQAPLYKVLESFELLLSDKVDHECAVTFTCVNDNLPLSRLLQGEDLGEGEGHAVGESKNECDFSDGAD